MELWNECLVNENLTTEIKSRVTGCQSQMGKFDLFFALYLGARLYSIRTIFRNHCRAKKWLLLLVNDWQTSLSHCFNHLELKNLSNLFTMLFWKNERIGIYLRTKVTPAPDYSIINHFSSSSSSSSSSNKQSDAYHPNTLRDYYRVIYYETLDSLITSLK